MAESEPIEKGVHREDEVTRRLERAVPESILLPYQQAWVADDSDVKICEKGRRIGISWAEAADAALYAARAGGGSVYYLAYNQDMTKGFIEDVAWWAEWYDLSASEMEEREMVLEDPSESVKVVEVEFASGNVVQALPSTPRNLRSKGDPGERVVIDEFAFVDDPAGLLKAAMAFLVWGGGVHIISTHNGRDNAFNELVEDSRAGRKPYSVHRTTFMDAVEQGLYERIDLVAGGELPEKEEWIDQIYEFYGEDAEEELDVVPSESGGKYFSRFQVERCLTKDIPVVKLELEDEFVDEPERKRRSDVHQWCENNLRPYLASANGNLKSMLGEDFARSADLSVVIPAQEQTDLSLEALFVLEMRNVPFEAQKQIVFYVIEHLPRFVSGAFDANGNGAFLAERARQRFGPTRIHEVKATRSWYMDHMPRYRAAFQDAEIALPQDADVLQDHMDVERVSGVPMVPRGESRKGTDGKQRHGDTAIAGCMLWYARQHQGAPITESQSAGTRSSQQVLDEYDEGRGGTIDEETGWGTVRGNRVTRGFG